MAAATIASVSPFGRSYGLPYGWSPRISELFTLARRNVPLAGADAIEWATRNVDRFLLGLLFEPRIVGIYFMAQQVSSLPQKQIGRESGWERVCTYVSISVVDVSFKKKKKKPKQ